MHRCCPSYVVVFLGLLSTFIGYRSATPADAAANTDWARLKVGQVAYLHGGEEDNDPGFTLVCHTLRELIAFFHFEVDDCKPHRKMGTVVVVTAIQPGFDDTSKLNGGISKGNAFVAIHAVKGSWAGWVQQIDLEPIIPVGTRIEMGSVNVELLQQTPPSGNCNRYVRVLDGPRAGSTRWTCDSGDIPGTKLGIEFLN